MADHSVLDSFPSKCFSLVYCVTQSSNFYLELPKEYKGTVRQFLCSAREKLLSDETFIFSLFNLNLSVQAVGVWG